jgi:transposase-like protein
MADTLSMALAELVRKAEVEPDVDVLREGVRVLSQALLELEVAQHLGAAKHERTPERTGQRNGYRERDWDTRVGTLELRVPRVRDGRFFPSLLEPRKRAERALVAVVREAYVQGVSTRRVDDLVKALGLDGISKSQVSALCQELDAEVERFRTRKLEGPYPYCWLDATFLKVRDGGRVVSMAVVIAVGVNAEGQREILGLDVGPSEDGAFWLAFLRSLVARGLSGVQLVTSDAHEGLKGASAPCSRGQAGRGVARISCGTPWRWCPRAPSRWSPPPSGPSSFSRTRPAPARPGARWPRASARAGPSWLSSWRRPKPRSWPTSASPRNTGGKYGRTIPKSD